MADKYLGGQDLKDVGTIEVIGFQEYGPGSHAGVSPAGSARRRYNEATDKMQVSIDGAAYVDEGGGGGGTPIKVLTLNDASQKALPDVRAGSVLVLTDDSKVAHADSKSTATLLPDSSLSLLKD
jgi:hypothetical protein